MPFDSAKTLVDQRITNLATIFSITLVVIGWLITNLTIKESISYELLFKETFIYPTFYFVTSLIGCLILASLLRHKPWLDLGSILITGSYLIVLALVTISVLFIRLIKVIGATFFYGSLEKGVLAEAYLAGRPVVIERHSRAVYRSFLQGLGVQPRQGPLLGGEALFQKLEINRVELPENETEDPVSLAFGGMSTHQITDIKLALLAKQLRKIAQLGQCYYSELAVGSELIPYYPAIYLPADVDFKRNLPGFRASFRLRLIREEKPLRRTSLEALHKRFKKDIAEGKNDQVKMALAIYGKVLELERQVNQIH